MSSKKEFIGAKLLSKTLCNRLIPVGKTLEWIEKEGWITEAEEKDTAQKEAKEIMDDFYRKEIQESLKESRIEWQDLFDMIRAVRKDSQKEKELLEVKNNKRKEIKKLFENRKNYKVFFKAELLKAVLPEFIKNNDDYTAEEKVKKQELMNTFNKFTGVFKDFWKNRENVFKDEEKNTAVGYRVVHVNAEIFMDNMSAFHRILKDMPEEIEKIEAENKELFEEWRLEHVFAVSFFDFTLTQEGIDFYDAICGAVNLHMNLYSQQKKISRIPYRMRKLQKQILSKAESLFEIPQAFENDLEVYQSVNTFVDALCEREVEKKCAEILQNIDLYNFDQIYLGNKDYTYFSQKVCSDWSILPKALNDYYSSQIKGKSKTKDEKVKQAVKNDKYRSILSMEKLINGQLEEPISDSGKAYIKLLEDILTVCKWNKLQMDTDVKLMESEEKIQEMKTLLDGYMQLKDWVQQFMVDNMAEKDPYFYALVYEIQEVIMDIVPLYNRVRNYVTSKPYEKKKIKLHFGSPTLADGWAKSKEYSHNCVLFMKDNNYYLGVFNPKRKPKKKIMEGMSEQRHTSDYKKVEYHLIPGANKMLPKIFIFSNNNKDKFDRSKEILDGYEKKKHIKSDKNFDIKFCHELIDFFKESIEKHEEWKKFNFEFSPTESYTDISGFYKEVDAQGYRLEFVYIDENDINKLVDEGSMYLFQIYNKDFAAGSKGNKNLHTLYFEYLFKEENLKDVVLKLNGEAEIFYRKASIQNPFIHKKGSLLINKKYEEVIDEVVVDGKIVSPKQVVKKSIPDENYLEIRDYLNGKCDHISEESKEYFEKCSYYEATMDIIKDRRYSVDQITFHCPICLNFKVQNDKNVNEIALSYIKEEKDLHIIGIDRGERNLIYISVIDQNGKIVEQKSFNIVNSFDYKEKLSGIENARQDARKNWREIGKIKEVKEGYLSQVIYEICQLLIKYNAIIVLEDLNFGFKRGRFKVERQVYQKFETMLIKKLGYLADKSKQPTEDGGLLRGYQMSNVTDKNFSFTKLGKQCGVMFYVPAAYTSKIDPTTGFADVFAYKEYTSGKSKKQFLMSFEKIAYDKEHDWFVFEFDYDKFTTYQKTFARKKWTACTYGERIDKKMNNGKWEDVLVIPTDIMKEICKSFAYEDGHDLKENIDALDERTDLEVINRLFFCIKMTMQMRNSKTKDEAYDRIISPIINQDGKCFDSNEQNPDFPLDADANGAYHIALKGLYLVEQIKKSWEAGKKMPKDLLKLTNEQWFAYTQNQNYKK